jgi:multidrug resistance efflux pump
MASVRLNADALLVRHPAASPELASRVTGEAIPLNDEQTIVVMLLSDGPLEAEEIVELASRHYGVNLDWDALLAFIDELERLGLLERVDPTAPDGPKGFQGGSPLMPLPIQGGVTEEDLDDGPTEVSSDDIAHLQAMIRKEQEQQTARTPPPRKRRPPPRAPAPLKSSAPLPPPEEETMRAPEGWQQQLEQEREASAEHRKPLLRLVPPATSEEPTRGIDDAFSSSPEQTPKPRRRHPYPRLPSKWMPKLLPQSKNILLTCPAEQTERELRSWEYQVARTMNGHRSPEEVVEWARSVGLRLHLEEVLAIMTRLVGEGVLEPGTKSLSSMRRGAAPRRRRRPPTDDLSQGPISSAFEDLGDSPDSIMESMELLAKRPGMKPRPRSPSPRPKTPARRRAPTPETKPLIGSGAPLPPSPAPHQPPADPYEEPHPYGEQDPYSEPHPYAQPEPGSPQQPYDPQAYGQPDPQAYGQPDPQAYGQASGQPDPQAYGQPDPQAYGQPDPQAYGQPDPQAYGQPDPQAYAPHSESQQPYLQAQPPMEPPVPVPVPVQAQPPMEPPVPVQAQPPMEPPVPVQAQPPMEPPVPVQAQPPMEPQVEAPQPMPPEAQPAAAGPQAQEHEALYQALRQSASLGEMETAEAEEAMKSLLAKDPEAAKALAMLDLVRSSEAKPRRRLGLWIVLGLVGLLLIGFLILGLAKKVETRVSLPCRVLLVPLGEVKSQLAGKVTAVSVKKGSVVSKKQTLARVSDEKSKRGLAELKLKIDDRKELLRIMRTTGTVQDERKQKRIVVALTARLKQLESCSGDDCKDQIAKAKEGIESAKLKLKFCEWQAEPDEIQAEAAGIAKMEQALAKLSSKPLEVSLVSSGAGLVSEVKIAKGMQVSSGEVLVELVDATRFQVEAFHTEKKGKPIDTAGVAATVRLLGEGGGRTYPARPGASRRGGSLLFEVPAEVSKVQTGAACQVEFTGGEVSLFRSWLE